MPAEAPVRIIVHAGFHKTGTTSLQSFLEANRAALARHAAVYLKRRLGPARYLGRWYGQRPVVWRRVMFRRAVRKFLRTIPDAPVILISRESFSGMMPGYDRGGRMVTGYAPHAATLATEIVAELRRRFGETARIELFYTLRNGEDWCRSLWGHVLRTSPRAPSYEVFRAAFGPTPDLAGEALAVAEAVAPVQVLTGRLEDVADDPLGPGRFVLDLLGVPEDERAGLVPVPPGNPGQSAELSERFRRLNARVGGGRRLRERKRRLWEAERERWADRVESAESAASDDNAS